LTGGGSTITESQIMKQHESQSGHRHQRGAVMIVLGVTLVMLIGFIGLAIDLGRFFVIKSELQNAMDACALAAASQLRPGQHDAGALTRAAAYGSVFATGGANNEEAIKNKANFQSIAVNATISFFDHLPKLNEEGTADYNKASHARCETPLTGLPIYFMRVLNLLGAGFDLTQQVYAMAVATPGPRTCNVIPAGICPPVGGSNVPGDWLELGDGTGDPAKGWFRWVEFEGAENGTPGVVSGLTREGICEVPSISQLLDLTEESGNKEKAVKAWNTRFGIYQSSFDKTMPSPDTTGYSYFNHQEIVKVKGVDAVDWYSWDNWKINSGVNDPSTTPLPSPWYTNTYPDLPGRAYPHFKLEAQPHHLTYADSFAPQPDPLKITSSPLLLGTGQYADSGNSDRRLVIVPTMENCTSGKPKATGLACALMLNPFAKFKGASINGKVEYLGPLGTSSPCGSGVVTVPTTSVLVQ